MCVAWDVLYSEGEAGGQVCLRGGEVLALLVGEGVTGVVNSDVL